MGSMGNWFQGYFRSHLSLGGVIGVVQSVVPDGVAA